MDSDQPHNDTLLATNRLLSDLERKLSIVSNTSSSSNQTQQSHSSSIIVDRNFSGIGKQNIQSSVLEYIKANEDEFNPNELFEERQHKFLTKLGRTYNDDKFVSTSDQNNYVTNFDSESDDVHANNINGRNGQNDVNIHNLEEKEEQSQNGSHFNVTPEMNYDDEDDTCVDEGNGNEKMFFDDDDDDLLLSPEPPRSPPREIDPDKVYGLYDFSGPDPLHCTLSRDEPVYLLNDEDNYWCLIKKLSKEERMAVISLRLNGSEVPRDPFEDEEYEKIGFVPAECLETYGERLARLNCFKNEELEKLSREDPDNDDSIQILDNEPYGLDNNSAQSNMSQDSTHTTDLERRNTKTNKSVTFEDLEILDFYDQEEDDANKENNEFGQHLLTVSHDELQSLALPQNDEDKISEVLSDVYPNEMPLIINKNSDKRALTAKQERDIKPVNDEKAENEPQSADITPHSPEVIEILDVDDDAEISHTIHINEETSNTTSSNNHNSNDNNKNESSSISETEDNGTTNGKNGDEKDEMDEIIFNNPYTEFTKPPIFNKKQQDNSSIGSFSPDTPPQRKKFSSPNLGLDEQDASDDEANLSSIRRSNVLDRLNKITSDIQEQLNLNDFDYESFNNDTDFLQNLKSSTDSSDLKALNQAPEKDDDYDFDDYDDYDDDYYYRNESEPDEQRDSDGVGTITPLTSSNSLTNGMIIPVKNDITDRRKSKPVHDMFIPVLGKFDLLAEKLAKLDELI